MPIYEYACAKCGATFEHLARTRTDVPGRCERCGAPHPEKQLSTFAAKVAAGHDHASACGTDACGHCDAAGGCPYE